jgi:hypothetical protein
LLDCFIELILPATADKNKGALLDEPLRSCKAYPTISARDDCNLSVKSFLN